MKKLLSLWLAMITALLMPVSAIAQATSVFPSYDLNIQIPNLGRNAGVGISAGDFFPNVLQTAQITLTASQIQSMFTTPVVLIAAPGVGKSVTCDYVMCRYTSGGTAFASGGAITVGYVGGSAIATTLPAATINTTTSSDTILGNTAADITATQNAGIQITNATGAFTTGNGTLTIYLWYSIQ